MLLQIKKLLQIKMLLLIHEVAHGLCGKFMHVCKIETERFDLVSGLIQAYRTLKSLEIRIYFLERKRPEEYLVINLVVERKL